MNSVDVEGVMPRKTNSKKGAKKTSKGPKKIAAGASGGSPPMFLSNPKFRNEKFVMRTHNLILVLLSGKAGSRPIENIEGGPTSLEGLTSRLDACAPVWQGINPAWVKHTVGVMLGNKSLKQLPNGDYRPTR